MRKPRRKVSKDTYINDDGTELHKKNLFRIESYHNQEIRKCHNEETSSKPTSYLHIMALSLSDFNNPDSHGNVMLGYYKNEEATEQAIDKNGWYHTGDLGTMDRLDNVFIKGRSKNMLLGSNGQNIYPEEIEDKLNSMPMVIESIVVQRGEKLVALVYPDYEEAKTIGINEMEIKNMMEQNRKNLNEVLPSYAKLSDIEIHKEEFEKTPKKSIKRYIYK